MPLLYQPNFTGVYGGTKDPLSFNMDSFHVPKQHFDIYDKLHNHASETQ